MGILESLRRRYVSTDDAVEADELRTRATGMGTCIADLPNRAQCAVTGVVRSTTRPAVGESTQAFTVALFDGTGVVDLVWLGRKDVPGVKPGLHLRATGRIAAHEGGRRMFNPRYEIVPGL